MEDGQETFGSAVKVNKTNTRDTYTNTNNKL